MLRDEEIRDATLNESFALLALMKEEVTAGEVARGLVAFARAVEQAAYAAAIEACETMAEHWQKLKRTGGPMRDHREGMADAAITLADRIRSLMEQPK